jgi:hypothetical protein
MNNLVALAGAPTGLRQQAAGSRVRCAAHEALQQVLFAVTEDNRLISVSIDTGEPVLEAPLPGPHAAIAVHALPELDAVFVATADGGLLLMHLDTEAWETVGEMEGGLLAASCSPDGELLVCLTRSLTLVALSPSSWEVLAERELEADLVDPDSRPSFAWRADGHQLTMLTRDSTGKSRVTVMDRGCEAEFVSEQFTNIGTAIAFQPDGSLIAASQQIANRHDIIFFEPNALRHYELTLPAERTSSTVEALSWSADGSLLAVSLSGAGGDAVQLWHRANYHWYLKYEVVSLSKDNPGAPWASPACVWHESNPLSALLFIGSDDALAFSFAWECMVSAPYLLTDPGSNTEPATAACVRPDWSTVASIDGKRLLLTPMRKMIIPPPMCAATLEAEAPIVAAAWGPEGRLALLCSDGSLLLCACPFAREEWDAPPAIEATLKVEQRLFQLAWLAPAVLAALAFDPAAAIVALVVPSPADGSALSHGATVRTCSHTHAINNLAPSSSSSSASAAAAAAAAASSVRLTREVGRGGWVLLLGDGLVLSVVAPTVACGAGGGALSVKEAELQPVLQLIPVARLPGPVVMAAALPGGQGWLGLSRRGKLWCGDEFVQDGVTSVLIRDDRLLLLTNAACRLRAYLISHESDPSDACAGASTARAAGMPPAAASTRPSLHLLCDDGRLLERGLHPKPPKPPRSRKPRNPQAPETPNPPKKP